jgi:uncharacterized radical SAM protein YgiQ
MHEYKPKFIPMSRHELDILGWKEIDILLITGDAYVDHPSFGVALIGRMLLARGYRVGIVAQPDWKNPESLQVMGRPALACAITSGNLDSMVNIYTAGRRFRKKDAYSVNGETGKRPPHALVVYTQLAKRAFPKLPIVLGGIEASLRRIAHYDYWQDKIRPAVLVDSKADIAVYGQGELPVPEIFDRLRDGRGLDGIPGSFRLLGKNAAEVFNPPAGSFVELPDWDEMKSDRDALMRATIIVEQEMNPFSGRMLIQRYGDRLLVLEPPPRPMTTEEFDAACSLPYAGCPHPVYQGPVPAYETIRDSIPAVRGCPGGCAFCGLVSHQGRTIISRSEDSIVEQIQKRAENKAFKGTISDIGGAAGNIYGSGPYDAKKCRGCRRSSCLFPKACSNFRVDEKRLTDLLRRIRALPEVKHLYVNSGIRLDLANQQPNLMREMVRHHVSGHLKVAPEHLNSKVLRLMRKNPAEDFFEFKKFFEKESQAAGKEQYLIPLFISNFPGCSEKEMKTVDDFLDSCNWSPQQVQDYIPLPMTMGAAMYYTGKDSNGNPIKVNRGLRERREQIDMLKKVRRGSRRKQRHKR